MAICTMQLLSVKITFIFLVVKKYFRSMMVGGCVLEVQSGPVFAANINEAIRGKRGPSPE